MNVYGFVYNRPFDYIDNVGRFPALAFAISVAVDATIRVFLDRLGDRIDDLFVSGFVRRTCHMRIMYFTENAILPDNRQNGKYCPWNRDVTDFIDFSYSNADSVTWAKAIGEALISNTISFGLKKFLLPRFSDGLGLDDAALTRDTLDFIIGDGVPGLIPAAVVGDTDVADLIKAVRLGKRVSIRAMENAIQHSGF